MVLNVRFVLVWLYYMLMSQKKYKLVKTVGKCMGMMLCIKDRETKADEIVGYEVLTLF
jgi:hypothetical protein